MSTIMKLTKHGAITHTHTHTHKFTPCLVLANVVDIGEVRNRISAKSFIFINAILILFIFVLFVPTTSSLLFNTQ